VCALPFPGADSDSGVTLDVLSATNVSHSGRATRASAAKANSVSVVGGGGVSSSTGIVKGEFAR